MRTVDEHTPLPWAVESRKVGPDLFEATLVKPTDGGPAYVADTFVGLAGGATREVCEANARLIVRAVNALRWREFPGETPGKDGETCLVVYDHGRQPAPPMSLADYREGGWYSRYPAEWCARVTHWMPLPDYPPGL